MRPPTYKRLTNGHGDWGTGRCPREVVGSPADSAVALAGHLPQPHSVEDDDFAPPISYQAVRLERVRDERHAGPAHTQHPGNRIVRQRELVLIRQVERMKQPAREAGFQSMQRIARSEE